MKRVIVAVLLMIIGLVYTIVAAQTFGLRLGGVIVIPLTAVYILYSFGSLPVFLFGMITSYVSIYIVKNRLLVYGRSLFIIAIVSSLLASSLLFEFFIVFLDFYIEVTSIEFFGSILPGIAAYNFHRLNIEKRILDILYSTAVLGFLVVSGIGLIIIIGNTFLSSLFIPVLLSPQSDIAQFLGIIIDSNPIPIITTNRLVLVIVSFGLISSEFIRSRYGLRIAGVVILPVIILASIRRGAIFWMWIVTSVITFLGIQLFNWWTLIYGRVLLSMAIIFGLLITVFIISITDGLNGSILQFFSGIISGVTAYNFHVLPRENRLSSIVLTSGVFVFILFFTRLFVVPLSSGILYTVNDTDVIIGFLVVFLSLLEIYRLEKNIPSKILSTFELASKDQETLKERYR